MNNFYKQLKRDLLLLEKLSLETEDQQELIKIESTIENISLLAGNNKCTVSKKPKFPNKKLLTLELIYLLENPFILESISSIGLTSTIEESNIPKQPLTAEEMIYHTYNFFRSLPNKEIQEKLEWLYQNKRFLFHIDPKLTPKPTASTLYLWYFDEPHIFISRSGHTEDYVNFSHEVGHAIEDMLNYSLNAFSDKYVFSEIISSICEVLSLVYAIESNINKEDAIKELEIRLNDCITRSKLCLMESEFLEKNTNNLNKISPRTLKKDIETIMTSHSFPSRNGDYRSLLDAYISKYLHYNYGFLLATELAVIYHHDREYASLLLGQLLHLDWNLPYEKFLHSINSIITPGASLEEFKHLINPKTSVR